MLADVSKNKKLYIDFTAVVDARISWPFREFYKNAKKAARWRIRTSDLLITSETPYPWAKRAVSHA